MKNEYLTIFPSESEDSIRFSSPWLTGDYFDRVSYRKDLLFSWSLVNEAVGNPKKQWEIKPDELLDNHMFIMGEYPHVYVAISVYIEKNLICLRTRLIGRYESSLNRFFYELSVPYLEITDAAITWPYCSGWSLPLSHLESDVIFSMHYPVKAAMQWVSLYNQDCGLYFGIHDPVSIYKTVEIQRQDRRVVLSWEFPDISIMEGELIDLPPVYLGVHKAGWRGGADIYRDWAKTQFRNPDPPSWYAQQPTWAWVGLREQYAREYLHILEDLRYISARVAEGGVNLLQLTGYNKNGHDTQYPDYWPGDRFGGASGLQEQLRIIHQKNRRMSIYVNGRLIDPDSSVTESQRQSWVVRASPEGHSQQEVYGEVSFDVMCPGAQGWRNLFGDRLIKLVKEFLVDGVYIDQVSAATSLPCYTPHHDHDKPNQAWKWYKHFIKELRENLSQINPDLFLATEGVSDVFGQYFDSQQAHNDWQSEVHGIGERLNELYRYTFPNHILLVGTVTDDPQSWYFIKLAHVLGCGIDFGVQDWTIFPISFLEKAKWIQTWYAENYQLFQKSKLCEVQTNVEGIKACAFFDSDTMIINGAWIGAEDDNMVSSEVVLSIGTPSESNVSELVMEALNVELSPTWTISNEIIQICFETSEIFGIKIMFQPAGGG